MKTLFVLILLLVLLAFVGGSAATIINPETAEKALVMVVERFDRPHNSKGAAVLFTVRPGDTSGKIGEEMERLGIITSAMLFKILVGYYGLDKDLKAGDYEISASMTMTDIITKLNRGLVKTTRMTVPEGWRLEEIADALDKKGIFRKEDFLAASRSSYDFPFLRARPPGASLEGYLFPDTYEIRPKHSATDYLALMLSNFQAKFTPAMNEASARKGLSVHQVLTLASIVEREAVQSDERAVIASVFLNRLTKAMPLCADPTIQYALGSDPSTAARWGYWKSALSKADLDTNSPYNTYKVAGLPPGPIANPGIASIKAVLEPADTGYLYFVAKGDGGHAFAATLPDHERNVQKYQAGR